jgi:hypothetical protein
MGRLDPPIGMKIRVGWTRRKAVRVGGITPELNMGHRCSQSLLSESPEAPRTTSDHHAGRLRTAEPNHSALRLPGMPNEFDYRWEKPVKIRTCRYLNKVPLRTLLRANW